MLISPREQTGTGFIRMDRDKGASFKLSEDPDAAERHASCKGNPATNEWIPSADTVRSSTIPDYPMLRWRLGTCHQRAIRCLLLRFRCTRRQTSRAEATAEQERIRTCASTSKIRNHIAINDALYLITLHRNACNLEFLKRSRFALDFFVLADWL